MEFVCSKCGHKESVYTKKPTCDCGGLWDLSYELNSFNFEDIDKNIWGMFRYNKFMPLLDDSWKSISLGEGMTPIIEFSKNLFFKMDYFMPTLSFKDRGAAMLMSLCKSIGVYNVIQDSSGNAGNSIAAYSARAGIKCEIFVPKNTSPSKIRMIEAHGAKVNIVDGSRDQCADECRNKVVEKGIYYANHVYNPFFYEGTKTYVYEIFEQLGRIPKNIFIPVGNGTLLIGVIKGLEHLLNSGCIEEFPQIFAIQSEKCDPLYKAYIDGDQNPETVELKPTLAEGIAIGQPKRGGEILAYAKKYKIKFILAPEDDILAAREKLSKEGIYIEHTTAANYASYLDYIKNNKLEGESIITMCGAGIKSDH